MASLDAGDEVIVPAPYWVSYPDMVLANEGTPVIVPCGEEQGFKLTPDTLRQAITDRTQLADPQHPVQPHRAPSIRGPNCARSPMSWPNSRMSMS